jgi:hypothetical protein
MFFYLMTQHSFYWLAFIFITHLLYTGSSLSVLIARLQCPERSLDRLMGCQYNFSFPTLTLLLAHNHSVASQGAKSVEMHSQVNFGHLALN